MGGETGGAIELGSWAVGGGPTQLPHMENAHGRRRPLWFVVSDWSRRSSFYIIPPVARTWSPYTVSICMSKIDLRLASRARALSPDATREKEFWRTSASPYQTWRRLGEAGGHTQRQGGYAMYYRGNTPLGRLIFGRAGATP